MSEAANQSMVHKGEEASRRLPKKNILYEDTPREWSRRQRFQIWAASHLGYWLMSMIGGTLRYEVQGRENLEAIYRSGHRAIFTFWHNRLFAGTWYFRHRHIVVMTTQNFDGEYITRFIRKLGYGAARGSSSRGGLKALAEMARSLRGGRDVAFTVDGPRGPRYQAKIGPVLLARKTAQAIFCFHLSYEKKWIIRKSWDQFQIPKPFSRVLLVQAPPIYVHPKADEEELLLKLTEVQQVLDRLREESDASWERSKKIRMAVW